MSFSSIRNFRNAQRLLDSSRMCYKRMMQGMKRRRRKKPTKGDGAKAEPQQAPLQPVYPEDREQDEEPEVSGAHHDATPEIEAQPLTEAGAPAAAPQRARKRRRGGKGRKPRTAAPAQPVTDEAADEPAEGAPSARTEEAGEPVATVPHAHPQHAKRQPKGTVVLTIGLPGSGKTSWFRRRAITPLSSDLLRMMLFDDIAEQRYQDLVFSTLRYLLRARMIARMPWNYVDATNLSPRERRGWIKMAQEFGYEVHAVFFDVPVDVCQERNTRRGRMVPDDVMQRMAQKLRPPTFEEGFSKITVVRVKKQAHAEPDNEVQGVEDPHAPGEVDENY
jgi:predicted kinase